ncbi:hypothetical protein GCM10010315_22440 [Streptomyces luteosporeus]|uniref:Uncharacterized protein n=1 Tax=Streptomyces luteosporeus TaxID=173856 RepID=A0ABP6G844_9ACTN
MIDVIVVTDLLDHLSGLEPQPGGGVAPLLRVVRGRAHGLSPVMFREIVLCSSRTQGIGRSPHVPDRSRKYPAMGTAETLTDADVSWQLQPSERKRK